MFFSCLCATEKYFYVLNLAISNNPFPVASSHKDTSLNAGGEWINMETEI